MKVMTMSIHTDILQVIGYTSIVKVSKIVSPDPRSACYREGPSIHDLNHTRLILYHYARRKSHPRDLV